MGANDHISNRNIEGKDANSLAGASAPKQDEHNVDQHLCEMRSISGDEQTHQQALLSREFLQGMLDALPVLITVLDANGEILVVNRAWREFVLASGGLSDFVGDNYLNMSHPACSSDVGYAAKISAGIRHVTTGETDGFRLEYPCHTRTEERWFKVKVTRLDARGTFQIVVAHENITADHKVRSQLKAASDAAIIEYERLLDRVAYLAEILGASQDLMGILRAMRDFTIASVPCSAIVVSLYDSSTETRKPVYFWYNGKDGDICEVPPIRVGSGPTGRAIKTGQIVISDDYLNEIKRLSAFEFGFDEDER